MIVVAGIGIVMYVLIFAVIITALLQYTDKE